MAGDARAVSALRWCAIASFALMSAGAGWRSLVGGDAVVSYLFITRDWDEAPALAVAQYAGYALLAAALLMWPRRGWPALVAVGAWMAAIAYMTTSQRLADWQLVPGAHAVRYVGPLATALLVASLGDAGAPAGRVRVVVGLLRVAVALTFICHGWEALTGRPEFLDLIFAAGRDVLGVQIAESHATVMLVAIGVQDVLLAAVLLTRIDWLRPWVAVYMAFWGLVTAASRTLHSGWEFGYEALVRIPNGGVPLALFLYWRIAARRSTLTE